MKKVCKFYPQGKCKFGDRCLNLHIDDPNQSNPQQMPQNLTFGDNQNYSQNIQINQTQQTDKQPPNICRFFLQGKCNNDQCRFFHGYGENLQNISKELAHEKPIVSLCQISEKKFITADDTCLKIWLIESKFENLSSSNIDEGKITKVIFANEKIILATQIEQMLSSRSKIHVITETSTLSIESSLKKVNDIIEVESYIIAVGNDFMESFVYSPLQNTLTKGLVISNETEKSEINTIALISGMFFCGHVTGALSVWMPNPQSFLSCTGALKIHDGAINKISAKYIPDPSSTFVITCSSDATLKVFKQDSSFSLIVTKNYSTSVLDFFSSQDFEGNECFILSLGDGTLAVTDMNCDILFEIPSQHSAGKRLVTNLGNPYKNETLGNFLIVTDNSYLSFNMWIQQGTMTKQPQKSYGGNTKGGHRGGHRGGRGHFYG